MSTSISASRMIGEVKDRSRVMETFSPINLLRCPQCQKDFSHSPDILVCEHGHSFSYKENVIDFSAAENIDPVQQRSKQSFGIEWTEYYANLGWSLKELAAVTETFLTCTRSMPNFFSNKIV